MLIDLEWTKEYLKNPEWITSFKTEKGDLDVAFVYPENNKEFQIKIAKRIHTGIYVAWNLWNDIEIYTKWEVEHPWTETKTIWDKLQKAEGEEALSLRDMLLKTKTTYGNADNLKQIIQYGRTFIKSADPYVVELHLVDVENNDRYLDKNGPYIGKKKNLNEVIHFNFHKLKNKTT